MLERTRRLWENQDQHRGDRHRLFAAVAAALDAEHVLYPGCYVDVAPSFVWPSVIYVDIDRRASQFFADEAGVHELLIEHGVETAVHTVRFIAADYTDPLDLDDGKFDLLVSLYAGFVSEACTRHLRLGGSLLVNASHGDAAMASIDPRYRLSAVVTSRSGDYRIDARDLAPTSCPSVTSRSRRRCSTRPAAGSRTRSHRSHIFSNGSPDHPAGALVAQCLEHPRMCRRTGRDD